MKLLLDHGVRPNTPGVNNLSPLYHAADNGQVEVARLLIAAGCNVDADHVQTVGGTAIG